MDAHAPAAATGNGGRSGWAVTAALVVGALVCVGLVATGIAAAFLRPLAPPLEQVPAASRWFDGQLLDRIAAYRRPLYVAVPVAVALGALAPLLIVTRPRVQRFVATYGSRVPRGRGAYDAGGLRPVTGARTRGAARIAGRAAVLAVGVVVLQDLILLPARWWIGYVHAGNFGLRTQSLGGWLVDRLVTSVIGWVGIAVIAGLVAWCFWRMPRAWPVAVALGLSAASAVTLVVWPLLVEPLRFDFAALDAGATRSIVEDVGERAGLGDAPILVADASRRTTRRNAYVSGWGATRRIVLYDTLLALPDDQIAAVVAHEVAHALHDDLARGWLIGAAGTVIGSAAAGVVVHRHGRRRVARMATDPRVIVTVVAVALLLEPVVAPAASWFSRRAEASADATALELTGEPEAFAELQRSLVRANLSDPAPPEWWVWWRMTHPIPAARIQRADAFEG